MHKIKPLYVHVPFCDAICEYCDFYRVKKNDQLITKWLEALEKEIKQKPIYDYETIYIGGGTPSCLSVAQLDQLLTLLSIYTVQVIEYTIEINPESLNEEKIMLFKKFGINRISIGVQILDDKLLKLLNRKHSVKDVQACIIKLEQHGFTNISIDMMYGLPYQTLDMWIEHLHTVCSWPITHISIYALTIEENSAFNKKHIKLIDNDLEGEMYEIAIKILEEEHFMQYEVANFAKDTYHSKHNCFYWNSFEYMNLSCGAVGRIGNKRYTNTHNINDYLNGNFVLEIEELSEADLMFEYIMLGLRLKRGIDIKLFNQRFNCDFEKKYCDTLKKHLENHNLLWDKPFLRTTAKGMELLHDILIDFMD